MSRDGFWGLAEATIAALCAAIFLVAGAAGLDWLRPAPTVYVVLDPSAAAPTSTASPTLTMSPTPGPDTVEAARAYARAALGETQYDCIDAIFTRESNWNPLATNPRTGAYGIPQAFPAEKMARFGSNWRTSPLTQVKWGIWYVNARYGSACEAYEFMLEHGWY